MSLALAFGLGSLRANAEIMALVHGGAGAGVLSSDDSLPLSIYPVCGAFSLSIVPWQKVWIDVSGSVCHANVVYFRKDIAYSGSLSFTSGGGAIVMGGGATQFRIEGEQINTTAFSAKAEVRDRVNDIDLYHSTLVKHSGKGGILGRLALYRIQDHKRKQSIHLVMGVSLDVAQHSLSSETTSIVSNNSRYRSGVENYKAVNSSLQYGCFSVLVGVSF